MKTTHRGYTICAEAEQQDSGQWTPVLSILNEDGEVVVAPVKLGQAVTFTSAAIAESAGVLVANYWIDGAATESEPTA